MCGITGIIDIRERRDIDRALLVRMNETQHHRGPDEGSQHIEPGVGLGHRRLSIIDVATGQQPLFNEDHSVVVVFNGEIYNFQELVPELEALGHVFRTRSDTEVIVHAWEAWGEHCVTRFRGMFAFVLWDRNRQTVFIARDRLGVKPMFYALLPDGYLIFGSELKSLLAHPGLRRDVDPCAVEEYFALGYIAEPRTIFASARKLPPAHTLSIRRGEPLPQPREYWDVRFTLDRQISDEDASEELRSRLRESVRLRMISEVPWVRFSRVASTRRRSWRRWRGCRQSQSIPVRSHLPILRSTRRVSRSRLRIAIAPDISSKRSRAKTSISSTGWRGYTTSLMPIARQFRPTVSASSHASMSPSRCRATAGTRSFGGYRRYRMHVAEERLRAGLPLAMRRPLFGTLGRVFTRKRIGRPGCSARSRLSKRSPGSSVEAYFEGVSILRGPMRTHLFSNELKAELAGYEALEVFRRHAARAQTADPLALIQYLDLKTYLVGDINTKVDRASMAHSLEVREPLMDHPLVEWLASLPGPLKIRGNEGQISAEKGGGTAAAP